MLTRTSRFTFTHFTLMAAFCGSLAVIWTAHLATAQEGSGRGTALGVRQQRVERMVSEIERKFKALAQALKETEPERADRLLEALKESRELQLNGRMTEIVKLLDQSQLDSALGGQQQALVDIRKLLALLLNEQNDREKALEESERLEKFRQQIENILQDQIKQKMEADRTANKDKTLGELEAQIKAVEELIQKQKAVNEETQEARGGAASKLGPVTEKQRQVKDETGKAADAMSGGEPREEAQEETPADEADPNSPESKSGAAKSGEAGKGKPGEPKSAPNEGEKKAGEPTEGEKASEEPTEGEKSDAEKSSGDKAGGEKSKGGKSGGKKSDGKKSDGSSQGGGEQPEGSESEQNDEGKTDESGEKKPPRAKPQLPAEQALRSAKQNQQKAESQLNKGKPRAAGQDQEKALEDLQKALSELKNDRDRIASLPPEAFKQMAEKQTDTSEQTKQLHAEMKQGKQQDGKSDGKPSAGSDAVAKAQQQMDQAAGDLDSQDPSSASRKQAKAIKELEKALQEIEERLAQLREETQLEKLARLEARFKEMLVRQKEASKQTIDLHAKRDSNGELSRIERLAVGKVSAEEQALAEAAQQAYDIIVEDGTSVVFPEIVGQLRDDLASVGKMIASQKTDPYVQSQQREIEISLEELIEALKKAQSQKESGGGGGGGGGGDQPLLPSSAELKLLRFSQLRINRRTEAFDKNRPTGELADDLRGEMQNISKRQQDVSDMTLRILERQ